jgi:hypothetical protein
VTKGIVSHFPLDVTPLLAFASVEWVLRPLLGKSKSGSEQLHVLGALGALGDPVFCFSFNLLLLHRQSDLSAIHLLFCDGLHASP